MSKKLVILVFSAVVLLLGALPNVPAKAGAVEDFYRGKSVEIFLAGGAKGSYAIHTRLLAKYLPRYIPGSPKIVVTPMPGAGGAKAANYLYNVAPKDGTAIGTLLKYVVVNQVIGRKGLRYDAAKYDWIVSTGPVNSVVAFWHSAPAKTLEEAKKVQVVLGSTGRSSETFISPTLMNQVLGTKFKIVTGYKGLGKVHLAIERGEVDGRIASWESIIAGKPHWLKENKVRILAQTGLEKNADLPHVPRLIDLTSNPEDRALLEFVGSGSTLGRIYLAPPGIPADRLAALRTAFEKTLSDPAYLAEAKKRNLQVAPKKWSKVMELVRKTLNASPDTVKRAKAAFGIKS
jgi:tripartite-type tricarboxylate transporter receptor subunit TctC